MESLCIMSLANLAAQVKLHRQSDEATEEGLGMLWLAPNANPQGIRCRAYIYIYTHVYVYIHT